MFIERNVDLRAMRGAGLVAVFAGALFCLAPSAFAAVDTPPVMPEPVPAGVRIELTDEMGYVYADPQGRTLYGLGGGFAGYSDSGLACEGERYTEAKGQMDRVYKVPALAMRPTCEQVWPPFLAGEDAKPVGEWTIVARSNGAKQWAFKGKRVVLFFMDKAPGQVDGIGGGAAKNVLYVPTGAPPVLDARPFEQGRILSLAKSGEPLYTHDGETTAKVTCIGACLQTWFPVVAPAVSGNVNPAFTAFERPDGLMQWAFRGKPLYNYVKDGRFSPELNGLDESGWSAAVLQAALKPPAGIRIETTIDSRVFADANGMSLYRFSCGDDVNKDRQPCDIPGEYSEVYWNSLCGRPGKACLEQWRPVIVPAGAKPVGTTWSIVTLDPTGEHQFQRPGLPGLQVWAYRGRPLYTYHMDLKPGDKYGDGWTSFRIWGIYLLRADGQDSTKF